MRAAHHGELADLAQRGMKMVHCGSVMNVASGTSQDHAINLLDLLPRGIKSDGTISNSRIGSRNMANKLNEAADYIEAHGWFQGDFENESGQVCSLGAIQKVTEHGTEYTENYNILLEAILEKTGNYFFIATWNDHPERTQDEVVSTMRKAANND